MKYFILLFVAAFTFGLVVESRNVSVPSLYARSIYGGAGGCSNKCSTGMTCREAEEENEIAACGWESRSRPDALSSTKASYVQTHRCLKGDDNCLTVDECYGCDVDENGG